MPIGSGTIPPPLAYTDKTQGQNVEMRRREKGKKHLDKEISKYKMNPKTHDRKKRPKDARYKK